MIARLPDRQHLRSGQGEQISHLDEKKEAQRESHEPEIVQEMRKEVEEY